MSVITIQLGQCGNQLGSSLFTTLEGEAASGAPAFSQQVMDDFFRESSSGSAVARSVLVDMEPKVVQGALKGYLPGQTWRYDPRSTMVGQGGSGNNWAMGYCHHGPRMREGLLSGPIRREVEACDRFDGFLLLQSMAGGTGSGLGASVAELLREEYPTATVMSQAVWPYKQGEVTVQGYNTLLTVSKLTSSCDAVLVTRNDVLSDICTKLLHVKSPRFEDLNDVAVQTVAHALLPCSARPSSSRAANRAAASTGDAGYSLRPLSETVGHLCAHPGYRLLSGAAIPQMPPSQLDFEVFKWEPMLWRLRSMMSHGAFVEAGHHRGRDPPEGEMHRSLAVSLCLRGPGFEDGMAAEVFGARGLYHRASPSPVLISGHEGRFRRYEMSASFIANSSAVLEPLSPLLEDVSRLMSAGAYLHQYARFGMEEENVRECVAAVEDTAARYGMLRASG